MTPAGWLPAPAEELFGADATAEESYEVLTVDVPPASWIPALRTARDELGCTYFDWLSAVDEPGTGMRVCAHVVALSPVRRLLLRTTVTHESPALPSAVDVYAGAAWHERETHEMFGVRFEGHPGLDHLLLPDTFEGHPLRKDFVLAARVAKAWPGAKEPGESDHGGPKRRQMLPPGVPDPNEWGPLKGQLPPAPARPARGAGRAAGERPARAAGDRPVRRTRTAAQGSASQTDPAAQTPPEAPAQPAAGAPEAPAPRPRRTRSASQGSVSQTTPPEKQPPAGDTAPETPAPATPAPPSPPRSTDAPWHHARPAFDEPGTASEPGTGADRAPAPAPERKPSPDTEDGTGTGTGTRTGADAGTGTGTGTDARTGTDADAGTDDSSDQTEGGPQ
ncbi:NADH-quinone oxidoreductase subunit C [Streptomyces naganishii]|uniref:Dehydrogenase n=1 Tax=Streptomyces naganishii JCM 4654 TaxID=1306179 RepID=A0A919CXW5_9ACTN|nr:NADH-quinone oxidoreductase subunit C [Streptomyces naganishii]GHD94090.1 dehydrogenase [Streptomyces naganishii JCM 4654]